MASRSTRTLFSSLIGFRNRGPARLAGRAGLASKLPHRFQPEGLEPRVMLAGDHPSLSQFPTADTVTLNGSGVGQLAGIIEPLGAGITEQNDLFKFTAPTQDFVTLYADAEASGSTLNSRLAVYEDNGSGVAVQAHDAFGNLIASQSGNGNLSAGTPKDGWIGFIAEAGKVYYVLVGADTTTGPSSTGNYTIRIDAKSDLMTPDADTGEATKSGVLARVGQDFIYKIDNADDTAFDSLTTYNGQADRNASPSLDVHVDIYDAQANLLGSDTDAGVLNDAFKLLKTSAATTYYLRVRSDEFLSSRSAFAVGSFNLAVDAVVNEIPAPIDPVTRRVAIGDVLADGFHSRTYKFTAEGTGKTIIAMTPGGPPPPPIMDGAISVYDENGTRVAFNDDKFGDIPQVEIDLVGGHTYSILLDAFSEAPVPGVSFNLFIETHHTNDSTQTPDPADDHINLPVYDPDDPGDLGVLRNKFRDATPLNWGAAFLINDQYNYYSQDTGWRNTANGSGRIQGTGDNDMFSFVPQVDMQGQYEGDNGDDGPSLFVGGAFINAGAVTNSIAYQVNHVASFDANEWWTAGRGFNGNVRAFAEFDDDGDGVTSLFAAGDFTSFKNDETEQNPTPANHIAKYSFNNLTGRWEWSALGNGVSFSVNALAVFDLNTGDANPPVLVIGGAGLVYYDGAAFTTIGAVSGGSVNALAVGSIDPPDPDGSGEIPDPGATDVLAIGGNFTSVGSAGANLALWDGGRTTLPPYTKVGQVYTGKSWLTIPTNGAVNALMYYDAPALPNGGPDYSPGFVVGGAFGTIEGKTANRIGLWSYDTKVTTSTAYTGIGIGGGVNNTVRSLTLWNPPDPDGGGAYPDLGDQIVAGGDFTDKGQRIARFDWTNQAWARIGDPNAGNARGFNQRVDALAVMTDADDVGDSSGLPTLYAGGNFTLADGAVTANHGAKLVFVPALVDWVWDSMGAGRDNGTNGEVLALYGFADADPIHWDHEQRPSSRLHLTVSPSFGPNLDCTVTIYDSNFQPIFTNANVDSAPWSSQLPDGSFFPFDVGRAGMVDPNLALPNPVLPENLGGITLWGGRTYYIRVSGEAGSTGRYDLTLTTDAWVADGPDRVMADPIDESTPANGDVISIPSGTGDNTNYLPIQTFPIAPRAAGTDVVGLTKVGWNYYSDYGAIETINDTDVYQFRAQASGYASIRVNTTSLADEWYQDGPATAGLAETYSSDLDSYLRILDGDFSQIAFNNDNPFTTGEPGSAQSVGTLGNRVFAKRDAFVTFPIVAGDFYFVIVGSGQKWVDATAQDPALRTPTDEREINYRVATGGYELLFNTMENLQAGTDDHSNSTAFATPVPIAFDPANAATNGKATVTGIMNSATDIDAFVFNSPARGVGKITLSRPANTTLVARIVVLDGAGTELVNTTTSTNGDLTVQFNTQAGAQYFVGIFSEANTTGAYTLAFNLPPYADDHADDDNYTHATTLDLIDYLGSGETDGAIENPGDIDVFRFEVNDYNTFTVSVHNLSPNTFDPRVEVYELSTAWDDPSALTMWMRIAANDDASGTTTDATTSFSVTPNRTSLITGQTYRWYYVFVMGEDTTQAAGKYHVKVTFPPTDDFPDAGQFTQAAAILPDPDTGLITQDGSIELSGDTDLFYFNALAGGTASVVVDRQNGSLIVPKVTVIFLDPDPITIATGTGIDSDFGFIAANTGDFHVDRGAIYYILVEATTEALGGYHITLSSPPLDDYPNDGEWIIAQNIPINSATGDGAIGAGVPGDPGNAHLTPEGDTDLFKFTPVRTGQVAVAVTSYRGTYGNFAPIISVYDVNLVQIATAQADSAAGINDPRTVEINFPSLTSGQVYYILINSVDGLPPPATRTGEYYLTVNGQALDDGGGGDSGSVDFGNPTTVALSSRTGDGSANDFIDEVGDRDLFTFTAPATGKVFVQVVTPNGSILDAALTILSAPNEDPSSVVFTDSAGIPGATANGSFDGIGGHQYYAIVAGVSSAIGAYRLIVDAEPVTFYAYYPEGYASLLIREFVSVSNANNYDVHFTVRLRYEGTVAGQPDETVVGSNLLVPAGSRGGVTISNADAGPAAGVQLYRPYAIVVESDGPIGATFSHYDFSSTLGDAFTSTLSAAWSFARVERNPGAILDFLVYYNPNPFDVNVTVNFYTANSVVPVVQTIHANKRLGLSVNDVAALPTGVVGANVIAAPTNSSDSAAFIGVVASLSHYDLTNTAGFGYLGDPQGGTTKGAIPSLTHGTGITGELFIFNAGAARATVTLTATYISANLPPLVRTFDVPAGQLLKFNGSSLGLTANQPAGISYTSNAPVVLASDQLQNGDADATSPFSSGATKYFFGDAFINTALAGSLYFETLAFYNPSATSTSITVTLLFANADQIDVTVPIGPRGYQLLKLHELPELIQGRPGLDFFSVIAASNVPFAATMTHYDLYLQGGWTTSGVPLGITNSFSTIP